MNYIFFNFLMKGRGMKCVFFFSSRARHTRWQRDWSSDVCSSDLIANLSGFDGSPESLRNLELEYGAEIGRAITNFEGPIVFCVVSRYHGGSFVVFSKALNENLEVAAVAGSYASVIGGVPAAAVVFAREVDARTKSDPRVKELQEQLEQAVETRKAALQGKLNEISTLVRSEKVGEVASEFDHIHTVERAAGWFH